MIAPPKVDWFLISVDGRSQDLPKIRQSLCSNESALTSRYHLADMAITMEHKINKTLSREELGHYLHTLANPDIAEHSLYFFKTGAGE